MHLCTDTFATPFGPFSLAIAPAGAVAATAFGDLPALQARIPECNLIGYTPLIVPAREQLLAYFAGERRAFDLPLAPRGTLFQKRVWSALQRIPFGETRSYGQLAAELGNPSASRAVGRANATNPICVIVPCHRVIGADGSLTGFAFGEDIKRRLLDHESRAPRHRSSELVACIAATA
jgi:methylated-DNA-[protein]-cysteine S-methyltransferase